MEKIGIFFGTQTGVTEEVAEIIQQKLGNAELFNVANTSVEKLNDFKNVIIAVSTHGVGQIQRDMKPFVADFPKVKWDGKVVALVGLGDQESHGDTFCNALGAIHDALKDTGCKRIGFTKDEGYEYEETESVRDGQFVGLALDNENQDDLTEGRIDAWIAEVKSQFV